MKKETGKKSLLQCVDTVFVSSGEMIEDNGEDSYMFSVNDRFGVVGVFDGCGGLGSRKYAEYHNKSGAYLAARVAAKAVMDWFERFSANAESVISGNSIQAICDALKQLITAELQDYNKSANLTAIKGSLTKSFPTTASMILFTQRRKKIRSFYIWAGDSRGYFLTPDGLTQITSDDIENEADALDNLSSDGKLSNVISAEGDFVLHNAIGSSEDAGILITSTDGCFGYFSTPMEFEYMLLDTLQNAKSINEWKHRIKTYIRQYTADDHTIGVVVYGYKSFKKLKEEYAARRKYLWEHVISPLNEGGEEVKNKLWNEYKDHYYRSVQ